MGISDKEAFRILGLPLGGLFFVLVALNDGKGAEEILLTEWFVLRKNHSSNSFLLLSRLIF